MAADGREQIELLFRRYGKGVGSYILTRVGDPELAEEITARVFLTVVQRFEQVRGQEAAWLWAVVRSELARHYRGLRPHRPPTEELADPTESPEVAVVQREALERLAVALDQLPELQHRLVYLKFFLGQRNLEIAAGCGMTPSNVGVLLHRALKQLRTLLEAPTPIPGARRENHGRRTS